MVYIMQTIECLALLTNVSREQVIFGTNRTNNVESIETAKENTELITIQKIIKHSIQPFKK